MKNAKVPRFALLKVHPGELPPQLQNLTWPEQIIISLYRVRVCVFKLITHGAPDGRQRAMKGQCISFPQCPGVFWNILYHKQLVSKNLTLVFIFRCNRKETTVTS